MAAPVALRLAGRFLGNAISESFAFAAGVAIGPALGPATQVLRNTMNAAYPFVPPGPGTLAEGVAQGQIAHDVASGLARQHGISAENFDRLVEIANTGPGAGLAFESWRRGVLDEAGFRRAVQRLGLEAEWIEALVKLHDVLLSPAELANARQQGFVTDARQLSESEMQGLTAERAEILYQLAGLPPGPATAQEALNRGLIDQATFAQMIREGHTKTKYTDLLEKLRQPRLSAAEYASAALRTWVTKQEMYDGGAQWGYTPQQMDLLFLNRGRPASPTQMWRAWARKAKGPRGVATDYQDHAKAIAISDIRPEYAELLWEIRFNYPPLFQLSRLVEGGVVDAATAATWAEYNLYAPEVVAALKAFWGGAGTGQATKQATAATLRSEYEGYLLTEQELRTALAALGFAPAEVDREVHLGDAARVKAYRDKALEAAHKSYIASQATADVVTNTLRALHIDQAAIPELLAIWDLEKAITRKTLTAAQIRAAYRKGTITQAEATADLEEHGYSASDAATFLAS